MIYDGAVPNKDSVVTEPRVRLLVSVFTPDEVAAALAGGADIVDVKNPAGGPGLLVATSRSVYCNRFGTTINPTAAIRSALLGNRSISIAIAISTAGSMTPR